MAGPRTRSIDTRLFAAYRLETLVTDDKNRIELYRLALNEVLHGSGEYRDAIHQAIYPAELAKARAQESEHKPTFSQLVKNRHRSHRMSFHLARI